MSGSGSPIFAEALFTFAGESSGDLAFQKEDENWWYGKLSNTKNKGYFPSCLVQTFSNQNGYSAPYKQTTKMQKLKELMALEQQKMLSSFSSSSSPFFSGFNNSPLNSSSQDENDIQNQLLNLAKNEKDNISKEKNPKSVPVQLNVRIKDYIPSNTSSNLKVNSSLFPSKYMSSDYNDKTSNNKINSAPIPKPHGIQSINNYQSLENSFNYNFSKDSFNIETHNTIPNFSQSNDHNYSSSFISTSPNLRDASHSPLQNTTNGSNSSSSTQIEIAAEEYVKNYMESNKANSLLFHDNASFSGKSSNGSSTDSFKKVEKILEPKSPYNPPTSSPRNLDENLIEPDISVNIPNSLKKYNNSIKAESNYPLIYNDFQNNINAGLSTSPKYPTKINQDQNDKKPQNDSKPGINIINIPPEPIKSTISTSNSGSNTNKADPNFLFRQYLLDSGLKKLSQSKNSTKNPKQNNTLIQELNSNEKSLNTNNPSLAHSPKLVNLESNISNLSLSELQSKTIGPYESSEKENLTKGEIDIQNKNEKAINSKNCFETSSIEIKNTDFESSISPKLNDKKGEESKKPEETNIFSTDLSDSLSDSDIDSDTSNNSYLSLNNDLSITCSSSDSEGSDIDVQYQPQKNIHLSNKKYNSSNTKAKSLARLKSKIRGPRNMNLGLQENKITENIDTLTIQKNDNELDVINDDILLDTRENFDTYSENFTFEIPTVNLSKITTQKYNPSSPLQELPVRKKALPAIPNRPISRMINSSPNDNISMEFNNKLNITDDRLLNNFSGNQTPISHSPLPIAPTPIDNYIIQDNYSNPSNQSTFHNNIAYNNVNLNSMNISNDSNTIILKPINKPIPPKRSQSAYRNREPANQANHIDINPNEIANHVNSNLNENLNRNQKVMTLSGGGVYNNKFGQVSPSRLSLAANSDIRAAAKMFTPFPLDVGHNTNNYPDNTLIIPPTISGFNEALSVSNEMNQDIPAKIFGIDTGSITIGYAYARSQIIQVTNPILSKPLPEKTHPTYILSLSKPVILSGFKPSKIEKTSWTSTDQAVRLLNTKNLRNSIETLAKNHLNRQFGSDPLRLVRAIYSWITTYIQLDTAIPENLKSSSLQLHLNEMPDRVFESRLSRGPGFAYLFYHIANMLDLECYVVHGTLKLPAPHPDSLLCGPVSPLYPNHAWNAICINGEYRFVDSACASISHPLNETQDRDDSFFLAHPKNLIYTHFPFDPKHQFISPVISWPVYWQLPYVRPSFFRDNIKILNTTSSNIMVKDGELVPLVMSLGNRMISSYVELEMFDSDSINETSSSYNYPKPSSKHHLLAQTMNYGDKRMSKILVGANSKHSRGSIKIYTGIKPYFLNKNKQIELLNEMASLSSSESSTEINLNITNTSNKSSMGIGGKIFKKMRSNSVSTFDKNFKLGQPGNGNAMKGYFGNHRRRGSESKLKPGEIINSPFVIGAPTNITYSLSCILPLHHLGNASKHESVLTNHFCEFEFYIKSPVSRIFDLGTQVNFHFLAGFNLGTEKATKSSVTKHYKMQLKSPSLHPTKFVFQPSDQSYILQHTVRELGDWIVQCHSDTDGWVSIVKYQCI
ncbi:cytokinesis protein 3 [Smittium culicis]|uniref:Cytokinesis protein 3 n=1 Tax=Smittium culicis TaxID=133412 RepID=A0A1R1Y359_9FUNG|nr:cytokinesis protein 3 [Smittium culicis]